MHAHVRDVLKWILGTDSLLYRQLTLSSQEHTLPEIAKSLLLRSFEENTMEACAKQSLQQKTLRNKHLQNPSIVRETEGWMRLFGDPTAKESVKRIICLCLLVRDFDDIRDAVEKVWIAKIGVDCAVVEVDQNAENFLEVVCMIQKNAKLIAAHIPFFADHEAGIIWDPKFETWKTALWHDTIARVKLEARITFCGEIVQHGNNVRAAADILHKFLLQTQGQLSYTAKQVFQWYYQDDNNTTQCNMKMVCDLFNYKSVVVTAQNIVMLSLSSVPQIDEATLENVHTVAFYCSNLVCKVDSALLGSILALDLNALKMVCMICEQIRSEPLCKQKQIVAAVSRANLSFAKLHHGACEMERCLRMYVYLRYLQDTDLISGLFVHLTQAGVFSAQDNARSVFAMWLCRKRYLAGRDSQLSAGIIEWGGSDLAAFCLRSNAYLRGLQPPSAEIEMMPFEDGTTLDFAETLDPLVFREICSEYEMFIYPS